MVYWLKDQADKMDKDVPDDVLNEDQEMDEQVVAQPQHDDNYFTRIVSKHQNIHQNDYRCLKTKDQVINNQLM
ncbi:hypothetical protein HanHA300_Chr07g0258141 [Helianthus annuus]|nr:hypothetical protein HanHA300_Chr07g0258141 [Helianthus annuus]KAJ0564493.1 hypothetical protein HanHA89_Chr07g0274901 [Helianthus annuus]